MDGFNTILTLVLILFVFCIVFCIAFWIVYRKRGARQIPYTLARHEKNPLLAPKQTHAWEKEAVFNPGAVLHNGIVHLFYRALGADGISRIGYAVSSDGEHFDRFPYPVYDRGANARGARAHLRYAPDLYASGGGWGGCEDPRAVIIGDRLYLTFGIFDNWESMRLGITSLSLDDLTRSLWNWTPYIPMSPAGETHKNWVLFPEKINGKFAILHALTPKIMVDYVDTLEELRANPIQSENRRSGRKGSWDQFVRGAASPPILTPHGWLLLYHGMNPEDGIGYKVGAMLLDRTDPTHVLFRCTDPILVPDMWYENDWKPGVVYASGAIVLGSDLVVYYGGGDKYIASARANLDDFLRALMHTSCKVRKSRGKE